MSRKVEANAGKQLAQTSGSCGGVHGFERRHQAEVPPSALTGCIKNAQGPRDERPGVDHVVPRPADEIGAFQQHANEAIPGSLPRAEEADRVAHASARRLPRPPGLQAGCARLAALARPRRVQPRPQSACESPRLACAPRRGCPTALAQCDRAGQSGESSTGDLCMHGMARLLASAGSGGSAKVAEFLPDGLPSRLRT
jgi:hypothetical protein